MINWCEQEFDSMKSPADRGRINSDEFVTMFQEMATRPEIYFLLIRFANRDYFTAEDFRHFLECEQAVTIPFVSYQTFHFVNLFLHPLHPVLIFKHWKRTIISLEQFHTRLISIA